MCGRMTLTRSGSEIAEYFALAVDARDVRDFDGGPLRPRYNIAPTQWVPAVVSSDAGARSLQWKRWGLVPAWSRSDSIGGRLFNARSETAHEKPSFRAAWRRRRCLVVADGFYEWTARDAGHQPHHFRARAGSLLGFAGLFEEWQGEAGEVVESCTVLTTEANADLEGIHHRMPVILGRTDFEAWLRPTADAAALRALMRPAACGTLEARAVDRAVNDARFDDPRCLAAASAERLAPARAAVEQGDLFRARDEGGA